MFFSSRRRPPGHAGASERFDHDVVVCMRALGRKLPALGRRYSMQTLTIAMAMHLRAMLALGLKQGHLTEEQARQLTHSLLATTSEPPDSEILHAAATPRSGPGK